MAGISAKPITGAQVRSIHAALHRQGIADADYRAMLSSLFGAGSCKDLTRRQASGLLARLGRPLPNPPGAPPRRPKASKPEPASEGAVRLATPGQRRLIAELAAEVRWRTGDGYRRWLKANMGLERVATSEQAARVIEGLKALKRRAADV